MTFLDKPSVLITETRKTFFEKSYVPDCGIINNGNRIRIGKTGEDTIRILSSAPFPQHYNFP
jgi:hypothetical protein